MIEAAELIRVGQTVGVREHQTFGVVVSVLSDGEPGHQVVEVGPEHLVLEQSTTGGRMRLPRYLVTLEPLPGARPAQAEPAPRAPEPAAPPPPPALADQAEVLQGLEAPPVAVPA